MKPRPIADGADQPAPDVAHRIEGVEAVAELAGPDEPGEDHRDREERAEEHRARPGGTCGADALMQIAISVKTRTERTFRAMPRSGFMRRRRSRAAAVGEPRAVGLDRRALPAACARARRERRCASPRETGDVERGERGQRFLQPQADLDASGRRRGAAGRRRPRRGPQASRARRRPAGSAASSAPPVLAQRFGSAQSVRRRCCAARIPMAVPGSLMPGESAREPISASTCRQKRGSWSSERSIPRAKARRSAAACSSSGRQSVQSERAGRTGERARQAADRDAAAGALRRLLQRGHVDVQDVERVQRRQRRGRRGRRRSSAPPSRGASARARSDAGGADLDLAHGLAERGPCWRGGRARRRRSR